MVDYTRVYCGRGDLGCCDLVADMSAPKLLPCPFCGGVHLTIVGVRDGASLGCVSCGCRFTEYRGKDDLHERLAGIWNTRADLLTAMTAERDALVKALTECAEALDLHGATYPAMVKGYTLDALTNARAALAAAPSVQGGET